MKRSFLSLFRSWHREPLSDSIVDAAIHGDVPYVQKLITTNPRVVTSATKSGSTLLHLATLHGHESLVEILLAAQADVNAPDGENECTPLHNAAFKGNYRIVELLIEHGANVNAQAGNKAGWTPMYTAMLCQNPGQSMDVQEGQHLDIVALLAAHGGLCSGSANWVTVCGNNFRWGHICPCCAQTTDTVVRVGLWDVPYCRRCLEHIECARLLRKERPESRSQRQCELKSLLSRKCIMPDALAIRFDGTYGDIHTFSWARRNHAELFDHFNAKASDAASRSPHAHEAPKPDRAFPGAKMREEI
jgi:ankyrin repeat protein